MWDKFEEMAQLIEGELRDNSEAVIDTREYIRRVMWDISGVVMMGYDFQTLGHRDGGMGDQFAKVLSEFSGPAWVRMVMHYVDVRPLLTLLSPLFMQTSLGKSLKYIRGTLRQIITEKEVKFQKTESQEAQDLDITSASVASGIFPIDELVDNGMLFMTAGPNSSGTAMEWAIYELSRRPEIQKRLREEINGYFKSTTISSELDAKISQLQTLPYLSAIVNEVIRCYPFIPLSARAAEKDTTLLGERIPKDTILLLPVDVLNHDTELWGPDGGEFNPDRWLGDAALTGGATSNYAMLSFGAGPNTCIGQNTARAMLGCFLGAFVRRFNIQLVNPETAARLRPALFKRSEEGMMAKLRIVKV
jgi:cytochrome P450